MIERKKPTVGLRSRFMVRAVALFNEDKTNPQIAEELGVTLPQVAYLLHEGRKQFKIGHNKSEKERLREAQRRAG